MILLPWSAIPEPTPDFHLHNVTAAGMSQAIFKFKEKKYTFGPAYHHVYPGSGTLADWTYSIGIRHSYGIEGRDEGHLAFLLPPKCIQDAGLEMLTAVSYLASVICETSYEVAKHTKVWF